MSWTLSALWLARGTRTGRSHGSRTHACKRQPRGAGKHPLAAVHKKERVAIVTNELYKKGTYWGLLRGEYVAGPRSGQKCVCKVMRSGDPEHDRLFDFHRQHTIRVHKQIRAFNDASIYGLPVALNEAAVYELPEEAGPRLQGVKALVEPYLEPFVKFNSNTGWEAPSMPGGVAAAMQVRALLASIDDRALLHLLEEAVLHPLTGVNPRAPSCIHCLVGSMPGGVAAAVQVRALVRPLTGLTPARPSASIAGFEAPPSSLMCWPCRR